MRREKCLGLKIALRNFCCSIREKKNFTLPYSEGIYKLDPFQFISLHNLARQLRFWKNSDQ